MTLSTLLFTALAHYKIGEYPSELPRTANRGRELVESLIMWGMLLVSVTYLMLSRYVIFRFYPYVRIGGRMVPILHLFLMFEIPFVVEIVLRRRSLGELGFSFTMPRNPTIALFAFGFLSGIIPLFFGKSGSVSLGYLVLGFFTPALSEEWFFRSALQQKIERSLGQNKAWMICGLMYGLIHIPTDFFGTIWVASGKDYTIAFLKFLSQCGFGWMWGILFIKCRNIFPVIISHYLTNYIAFIISPLLRK